jgi:hypothetical protein
MISICHSESRQVDATKVRQKQPSNLPPGAEYDLEELHRHVPRDADGVPIFFVLSAEDRAVFDQQMALCEAGWRETREPAFVGEAIMWAQLNRQPLPPWLNEAVHALAVVQRSPAHVKQERDADRHWKRYRLVREANERGRSWMEAYGDAEDMLKGTDAAGESSTMKSSYVEVKADLQRGRYGRYQQPVLPNEKARQWLGKIARRKP